MILSIANHSPSAQFCALYDASIEKFIFLFWSHFLGKKLKLLCYHSKWFFNMFNCYNIRGVLLDIVTFSEL